MLLMSPFQIAQYADLQSRSIPTSCIQKDSNFANFNVKQLVQRSRYVALGNAFEIFSQQLGKVTEEIYIVQMFSFRKNSMKLKIFDRKIMKEFESTKTFIFNKFFSSGNGLLMQTDVHFKYSYQGTFGLIVFFGK